MTLFPVLRRSGLLLLILGVITLVRADTDSDYEAATGLDQALKGPHPTMKADPAVEGKIIEVDKAFGQDGCKAKFEFVKAMKGTSSYPANHDKNYKGPYVKIKMTYDKTKCEARCSEIKVLQVFRDFTKKLDGTVEPAKPDSEDRQARAGWDDPKSPSRGWGVDSADKGAFYGPGGVAGSAENGSTSGDTDSPTIARDSAGFRDWTKNKGTEFISCAVCVNANQKSKVIACVRWGFYIDRHGRIEFEPKPPKEAGNAAQELKDAVDRFDKITGNTPSNIQF